MKTKNDPRHQSRRLALQILFEWAFHTDPGKLRLEKILAGQDIQDQDFQSFSTHQHEPKLLENIVVGVEENKDEIDQIVALCAPEWPLNQIARVDLSILRIAIYELLHHTKTPLKVAIDEAVELAKEFGGTNSPKFVNGVLGTVVKNYVPAVEQLPSSGENKESKKNKAD